MIVINSNSKDYICFEVIVIVIVIYNLNVEVIVIVIYNLIVEVIVIVIYNLNVDVIVIINIQSQC